MPDESPFTPSREFVDRARSLEVEFEPGDLERLGRYLARLLEVNAQFNLTSITEPREAWMRHILDSLTLVPLISSAEAKRVVDVGSGGGLPGLPLAIVMPEVHFTLVEATGKKARFLEQVARELEVSNVTVVNERAETLGQNRAQHREQYDLAIARAVGRLPVLLELTVPLVGIGGHVLAMKGAKAKEEIAEAKQALHLLHAAVAEVVESPTGVIVVIEKLRKTPRTYPRRSGEPKRVPLGG